jgi:hypothetical protein
MIQVAKDKETGLYITEGGEVLKPVGQWPDKNGYKYVTINHKNYPVHRLVAINYVSGKSDEKNVVMHKDDNPGNNEKSNLEWGTYSRNNYDAYAHGLKTRNVNIRCVETGELFYSARDAARRMFGIPKRGDHILQVIRADRSKAYGFHWEVMPR